MIAYHSNDILLIIRAKLNGRADSGDIQHLSIDSRKIVFPESTLFFAITTSKRDGHDYIKDLYSRGVRHFVISKSIDYRLYSAAQFMLVKDVVESLHFLVATHRKQFDYPVIGITGSNGKTIVKEWLFHVLQNEFNIVRSPRSYNSQLGVPLSVWQMDSVHNLGIFEAGISTDGEMQNLQHVIHPDIGVITNIGEAHNDGFETMLAKLEEKLVLFQESKLLVYCKDHTMIDKVIHQLKFNSLLSWGKTELADVRITNQVVVDGKTSLRLIFSDQHYSLSIPFSDPAAIENAMHVFTVALYLGVAKKVIDRLNDLPPLAMRLEKKEGQNQCTLINDSYNADLNGLFSAIEFMSIQGSKQDKTVIISDITGIVEHEEKTYSDIAEHLAQKKVQRLIGIGPNFQRFSSLFTLKEIRTEVYLDPEEFLSQFQLSAFRNELILIKGSRASRLERISHLLERKIHQTRLEIDLPAITHNLMEYRNAVKRGTGLMAMVKAFSYGSGSYEIANLLQFHQVEYLAVAYVDEGVELRKAGINLPIMVMNTEPQAFPELLEFNLEPELFSIDIAKQFDHFLQQEGISFSPVHIKVDTGMHRLGFDLDTLNELISLIQSKNSFKIQSVFTHLVASENEQEDDFTKQQIIEFDKGCAIFKEALGYSFLTHAANTAAITRHPNMPYSLVRLGIGLYGIDPGNTQVNLIESSSLKTTISQIKLVSKGESVGYGRKTILQRNSIIATIRIGYADGYPRSLGNGIGSVLIKGKQVKTIGNVCMDMTMVDITDYSDITIEDEVLVFGKGNSIRVVAEAAGTIPYEIMTGISQRVQRVYFHE